MSVRQNSVARRVARGRRIVADLSRELEAARVEHGLSYADIGRAVGLSGQQVARICQGRSGAISITRMATLLAGVGLELSARAFPAGPPIRDAAHIALLRRLRQRLAPALGWHLEVPVVLRQDVNSLGPSFDRRAWDAVIEGSGWRIGVEAETRLGDVQAVVRRVALKRRDGGVDGVVLLLNQTAHNYRVMADGGADLRSEFPASARDTLRRLARGARPDADTVLLI